MDTEAQIITRDGRSAIVADPEAFLRGHIGGNDPAELAKLLPLASLGRIAQNMPGTLEGETARREIMRRQDPAGLVLDTAEIKTAVSNYCAALSQQRADFAEAQAALDQSAALPTGPGSGRLRHAARFTADELDRADVALAQARGDFMRAVTEANPGAGRRQIEAGIALLIRRS